MKGQAKLPATLPSPEAARQALYQARGDVRQTAATWEGLRARLKDAQAERKAADRELDELEPDLLDPPDEDTGENTAKAHTIAWRRLKKAEKDLEKVAEVAKHAKLEHRKACARLATAREDLEAVREGRRRP